MPVEQVIHPRQFADADKKLTGVMHRLTQHTGHENPAVAALATELLEICTGKTPVVTADEVAARTPAVAAASEDDLNEPLVVPAA